MADVNPQRGSNRFGIVGRWLATAGIVLLLVAGGGVSDGRAQSQASEWSVGHASRVRLIAGGTAEAARDGATGPKVLVAGLEIDLEPGWKTYWRNPGEAGGVPPDFDWSGSKNVASVSVAFPAPVRMRTEMGDLIGYKDDFIVPVTVTPKSAGRAVELDLKFHYGVCRDICIPAEADLDLVLAADAGDTIPEVLSEAMAVLPRSVTDKRMGDPELTAHKVVFDGKAPRIVLTARFPGDTGKADLFAEAPAGIHLPMAHRVDPALGAQHADGSVSFVIDLNDALDIEELKGQTLTVTLKGEKGQSVRQVELK